MAKFCGKCGSKLDEATGLCPKCDADRLARLSAESVKEEGKQEVGSNPEKQSNKKNVKKQKKADKKAAKKVKKKEKRAQWSAGKKIRHFFLMLFLIIMLVAVFLAGALGVLTYCHVVDIPVFSNFLERVGITSNDSIEECYIPSENSIEYDENQNIYFANNELIVVFRADATEDDVESVIDYVDGEAVGSISSIRMLQIKVPHALSLQQIDELSQKIMRQFDFVLYATYDSAVPEADNTVEALIPNDPWNGDVDKSDWKDANVDGSNWWIEAIEAQHAWAYNEELSQIKIGISDSSFDIGHTELKSKCSFPNKILEARNSKEDALHGTHVAGIIGAEANNQEGLTGLVWKSDLLLAPLYSNGNSVEYLWWDSSIYANLTYLVEGGAKIINYSQGKTNFLTQAQQSFSDDFLQREGDLAAVVTASLLSRGFDFIVIQSAGNGLHDANIAVDAIQNGWFASITDNSITASDSVSIDDVNNRIIVVGAAEKAPEGGYRCTYFSNYGPQVDICAPGSEIYSTIPDGYDSLSGTSMAAPIVTGVCAMTWAANPSLTGSEVKELVCRKTNTTVRPNPASASKDKYALVNAKLSVEAALGKEGQFQQSDVPIEAVEHNGHYYYLYDFAGLSSANQNTWENALSYCQGVNGYLATITSQEENEFVYNYMKTQGYESAYFGLSNKNDEAAWKWCNGETADYSNWALGEPNGEANECYGMFYYKYPDGTWNDGSFEEDPQPIVPESENTRVFVKDTNSGLNLRSLPQHQSDLMGTVSDENAFMKFSGEIAQGLGSDGNLHDWYKVYLDNGIEGWARSDLIREVAPAEYGSESTLGSETGKGTVGKGGTAFICEWGEYSIEKDPQGPPKPVSNERDIVLVLDTSGSMSGTPMEETKKASVNFIETILEEDASIGIVTYDNSASRVSDFSVDKSSLENIISGIYDGGGTNIEAGLREAHSMLSASSAKKRIIVLMSDGEPNDGKEGDDLVAYADEIKKDGVLIYTLGFFESLGGYKSSAQQLMERIASDGCHYEVANADDLVFFFEDMADQINGQKYIYVRIACPVDVSVTYEGETLSSAEKDLSLRTDFGTLTFEQDEEDLANGIDDRVKVLRLKEGTDYNLKIVGTGHGIMDYTIGFMDDNGDYSDLRRFENVKITKRTVIDTEAAVSKQSTLNIDEDGDGKYDVRLRAGENGYGEEIEQSKLTYFVVGGCGLLCLLLVVIIVRKVQKKKKGKVNS